MPRILSYTPAWLARPSSGFELFADRSKKDTPRTSFVQGKSSRSTPAKSDAHQSSPRRPRRAVAVRGTEIFVAVGNEIRWSDLILLRDNSVETISKGSEKLYRTLKVPVYDSIEQLVISPCELYMVIVTTHTAYVAVLPDPLHLELDASSDPGFVQRGAIRLKSFQLGPTAHVLEASRLVSVLWHPLSETLRPCLVTVTQDAAVRVWEVNRADRWSFNQPASSVDLKKLAKARSIEENIEASEFGASRDFSPDYVEMEVAAASFGGLAGKSGNPWSSMTLWVAMTAGDIYALSPLLPSRWQTHSGHLKALALDVAAIELEHVHPSRVERRRYRRLNKWIIALEECELNSNGSTGTQNCAKLYGRPASFGPIPDLQGPFDIKPSLDGCSDITDLLAVDVTNAARGLYTYSDSKDGDDSDAYDDDSESSSVTSSSFASPRCDNACFELIYILTEASEVHICLGTDIVRGRWLPSAKDARLSALEDGDSDDQESNLINCETVRVGPRGRSEASAAVFSSHTDSPFDVYITNSRGIHMISTARWVEALIGETRAEGGEGIDVRIDVLVQGLQSEVQTLASHQNDGDVHDYENEIVVNACITLTDSDLGKFVFAVIGGEVYAVTLNRDDERSRLGASHLTAPSVALVPMQEAEGAWNENLDGDTLALTAHGEPRPAYRPAGEFWATSELKVSILEKMRADGRSRRWYTDSIRLSPATLDLLTEAHRILSKETYATGVAAAELFRRCERLRDELSDQVRKINIIAYRVEQHVDEEDGDGESGRQHDDATVDSAATASDKSEDIDNEDENRPRRERRMSVIRSRQQELRARHEALQRKMGRVKGLRRGGTEIGDAERAWMREVEKAEGSVRKDGDVLGGDDGRGDDDDTFDNDSDGGEKGQDERAGSMVSTRRRYEAAKQLAQSLVKTGRSLLPPDDEMTPGKAKQGKQNGSGIVGGGRESAVNEVEEWADYEDESGSENGYETANERGGENHRQRQNGAVRKEQTEGLMRMLERESALVEAATARLQRLSTAVKATV